MPPKRKLAETTGPEASTSTRATRSSTRSTTANASAASAASKPAAPKKSTAKKAAPKKIAEQDDGETSAPPAKKSRTSKATTKTKAAEKASDPSPSGFLLFIIAFFPPLYWLSRGLTSNLPKSSADKSGAGAPSQTDDDSVHNQSLPVATPSKTTTSSAPPPQPVAPARAPPAKAHPSKSSIETHTPKRSFALFKNYADSDDSNVIGPEGFERICTDANIPLDGALPLILAWQLDAKEMAKITMDEWSAGTESLKISSLPALSLAVHDLENILLLNKPIPTRKTQKESYDKTAFWKYCEDTKAAFHKLYLFCFSLAKPEQSRNIDMETATALWSVLLVPKFPLMEEVLSFITEKGSYKAANKDLWSMMLEFCETVNPNLSDYEGEGAWPTLLDDFVLWKKGPMVKSTNDQEIE